MPTKVYNNVEDYRVLDGAKVVEDITSVGLPTVEHPTSTISASGMLGDVDLPDITRLSAMSYTIAHNNGVNCNILAEPRKHTHEFRLARQRYTVGKGELDHESVKYRLTGVHVSSEKGSVERGNPLGSTEKYSTLRYEEEINGKIVLLIDFMTDDYKVNGVAYKGKVKSILE